jgi:hypothetical protein
MVDRKIICGSPGWRYSCILGQAVGVPRTKFRLEVALFHDSGIPGLGAVVPRMRGVSGRMLIVSRNMWFPSCLHRSHKSSSLLDSVL